MASCRAFRSSFRRRQVDKVTVLREEKRAASVFLFGEDFVIDSCMIFGMSYGDPAGFHMVLRDPANDALGQAVKQALSTSRTLTSAQASDLLLPQKRAAVYDLWVAGIMEVLRVRSRRALFKSASLCNVTLRSGFISLSPMRRDRGEGFEGIGSEHEIRIDEGLSADEVGAATRRALALAAGI